MAARVAQAEAARVDPAVGAGVAAHAVHVVIVVGVAAQVLTHTLTHFLDGVGMNAREPQVGRDHRLAALEADDLAQAARYVDAAHLVAPFPDAFVGTAERQRVALFALPQRRLDAFGLGDVGVDHDAAAVRQAAVAALQNGAVGTHALGAAMLRSDKIGRAHVVNTV